MSSKRYKGKLAGLKFLRYGNTLHGYLKGFFFQDNIYLHMISTLDVDFKPNPHKMLPQLLQCIMYKRSYKNRKMTLRGKLNRSIGKLRDKQ